MIVKCTFWLTIFTITFIDLAHSQNVHKIWDRTLKASKEEEVCVRMFKVSNNRILVACNTWSNAGYDKSMDLWDSVAGPGEPWILMLDNMGNKIWDRDLYGSYYPVGFDKLNDNEFVFSGFTPCSLIGGDISAPITPGTDFGNYSSWLFGFDSLGNSLWNKRFALGTDTLNLLWGIAPYDIKVIDNKIYVTSHAEVSNSIQGGDLTAVNCTSENFDILLYKLDPSNSASNEWHRLYGGNNSEHPSYILPVNNNGLLIGGITNSPASCNQTVSAYSGQFNDFYLVRVDSSGNIIWQQRYGGNKNDWMSGIIELTNNEFILYGHTTSTISHDVTSNGYNDTSIWVLKIDSIGNIIWDKRFGGCEGFNRLESNLNPITVSYFLQTLSGINTSDGGFLLARSVKDSVPCGDVTQASRGMHDFWLLKLDSNGNKEWDKRIGGSGKDIVHNIVEMAPGYYIAGGISSAVDSLLRGPGGDKTDTTIGLSDIWLVGIIDSSVFLNTSDYIFTQQLSLFPNPASDYLNISLKKGSIQKAIVYDATGRIVYRQSGNKQSGLSITGFNRGLYILECEDDIGNTARAKFLKQ